ncbi:MAG: phosphatidate cytidylyltransferase [Bacillota bacterium]
MKDLSVRIRSLVLFMPPILIASYYGGWILGFLVLVAAQVGLSELQSVLGFRAGYGVRLAIFAVLLAGLVDPRIILVFYPALLLDLLPIFFTSARRQIDWSGVLRELSRSSLAFLYMSLFAFWPQLANLPGGRWALLATVVLIWVNDAAAYLIGSRWGNGGMVPALSPNKSWIGAIAGILGAILVALVIAHFAGISIGFILPISIAVAVAGQFGDLFESILKRAGGVKDSGNIFPGHGGLLDRIDSLLFAVPVTFILLYLGII